MTFLIGATGLIVQPAQASAAAPGSIASCKKTFFGLEPWYQYMKDEFTSSSAPTSSQSDPCSIKCFNLFDQGRNPDGSPATNDCGQTQSDVPAVLLAIIDDLLRVAGIVAIAFVLVGAFQLVTSQGNSEQTAKARSTITNALAGTAIAITAIAFISFLGNKIGG